MLPFAEIQAIADRGGFRNCLDGALEQEAAVQRRLRSKRGFRMTAAIKADCLQAVEYMFEHEINRCMTETTFDPVRVFELRFYAECYAIAKLVQMTQEKEG